MNYLLKDVRAVDFDLDGTFYPTTGEIDNRIRNKISEKILELKPEFKGIGSARAYFEERYSELQGGRKVLKEAGYKNASKVMEDCLAKADVLDLIQPNKELNGILVVMNKKYELNLLTSSPEELSLSKLEMLGIDPGLFSQKLFSASKSDGTDFHTIVHWSVYPAFEHAYVGDRLKSDIFPAKKLGMKTVAVWSEIPEADVSIKSINEIGGLFL